MPQLATIYAAIFLAGLCFLAAIFGSEVVMNCSLNTIRVNLPSKNITEDSDLGQLRRKHPLVFFNRTEYLAEICLYDIDKLSWNKWFAPSSTTNDTSCKTKYSHWACICSTKNDLQGGYSLTKTFKIAWTIFMVDCFYLFVVYAILGLCLPNQCHNIISICFTILAWIIKVCLNVVVLVTMLKTETLDEQSTVYPRYGYVLKNEALRAATTKSRGFAFVCMVVVLAANVIATAVVSATIKSLSNVSCKTSHRPGRPTSLGYLLSVVRERSAKSASGKESTRVSVATIGDCDAFSMGECSC